MEAWLREDCGGEMRIKQIRAYKSREIGYPAFENPEENDRYLQKTISESCAYRKGFGPNTASYFCSAVTYCRGCGRDPGDPESGDCCEYGPGSVTLRRDRIRLACERIISGEMPVRAPGIVLGDPVLSETMKQQDYASGGPTCCNLGSYQESLSDAYTAALLEADIAAMKASVDWDADFEAWNCAGEVIGLQEGHFIFPHNQSNYFDAHFYTDELADPKWIDKAWMLLKNDSPDSIEVTLKFFALAGGDPVETVIEIAGNSTYEVAPPLTPGYIVASNGGCEFQNCEGDEGCSILPTVECQTRTRSKTAGDLAAILAGCYHCAFAADENGNRKIYKTLTVSDQLWDNFTRVVDNGGVGEGIYQYWNEYAARSRSSTRTPNCAGGCVDVGVCEISGNSTGGYYVTQDGNPVESSEAFGTYSSPVCDQVPGTVAGYRNSTNTRTYHGIGEEGGDVTSTCECNVPPGPCGDCLADLAHFQYLFSEVFNPHTVCSYVNEDSGRVFDTVRTVTRTPTTVTVVEESQLTPANTGSPPETRTHFIRRETVFTLSEEVKLSEICQDDDNDPENGTWSPLIPCSDPTCAVYNEFGGTIPETEVFQKTDLRYKLVAPVNSNCPDPLTNPSVTYKFVCYEIGTPVDCNSPIVSDKVETLIVIPAAGEPPIFPSVETALRFIDAARMGESAEICVSYPTIFINPS